MKNQHREDKVKSLRMLEIDALVRSNTYPNATDLAKKFEISRSTVMRDIDFLRDRYNAPLEYDFNHKGFYYTDTSFFLKSVMLTEAELFTLAAVQPLLEQYRNTPLESSFKKIYTKLTELLPNQISVSSLFAGNEISFISDPLPKIDENVFTSVFESLKTCKVIAFEYRSLISHSVAERKANPLHFMCQKGNWYMLAFCHKHQTIRTFSLSRMHNIQITNESFSIPADFNAEHYFEVGYGIWNNNESPQKIELLFAKSINTYILERRWHDTQDIKQNADGTVLLSISTNQLQEVIPWVLSFGSSVQVLSPQSLIEQVKEQAQKIVDLY